MFPIKYKCSVRATERKKNMAKKAAENILVVNFKRESQAYQAFSELKEASEAKTYFISQAAIVKKEDGEIVVKDQAERLDKAVEDTLKGGLIGGLVGLLAGPVGALVGGGVGALLGDAKATNDSWKDYAVMEHVSECVAEGETVLLLLADEKGEEALTEKLSAYDATIARFATGEVVKEIERAEKAEAKAEEAEYKAEIKKLKKYYNAKVSENVLIVDYKNESDVYQAFHELKEDFVDDYYFISQAAIVQNNNGEYVIKDEAERLEKSFNDTLKGGFIGGLIGLLGGPLSALYAGGVGATIGGIVDTGEAVRDFALVDYVYTAIPNGATVLVLQADEKGNDALTKKLNKFDCSIARVSIPKLVEEIERAEEYERKRKEEENERELRDMYNRTGNSFKL